MKKHVKIKIFGIVQGVFFRDSTKEVAEQLGIVGFVRNESDGTVYIEAEGYTKALKKFLQWCKQGPRLAKVKKITINQGKPQGYPSFVISR